MGRRKNHPASQREEKQNEATPPQVNEVEDNGEGEEEKEAESVPKEEEMPDAANLVSSLTQNPFRKRRYFFIFGVSLGVLIMLFLGGPPTEMARVVRENQFLQEYVASLSVPRSLSSVREQLSSIMPEGSTAIFGAGEADALPGERLAEKGLTRKHPVILVPGIVSTGLEIWKGDPCARRYFRQRIWGTMTMVQQFLLDTKCWLKHISLDPETGLDPPSVRVRAAQGFEAADYVIGGYWVWAKLIENLAAADYGPNSMHMASYDWRLSFENLEVRDRYFSRLRWQVEHLHKVNHEKVVFVCHSMGTNVYHYFSQWVTRDNPKWIDKHVAAMVNIAGPLLGLPKATASMYSGETQELRELGTLGLAMQQYMNQTMRIGFFRDLGSVASMLPRGGDRVWSADRYMYPDGRRRCGEGEDPDDAAEEGKPPCLEPSLPGDGNFSKVFLFEDGDEEFGAPDAHMGVDEALAEILRGQRKKNKRHWLVQKYANWYSHGIATDEREMRKRRDKRGAWTNIMESPLPHAPNMKIFCIYGVNRPTERQYYYKAHSATGQHHVNTSVKGAYVRGGIGYSDGDGSVPLISLGAPCSYFWRRKVWNPSGVKVVIREILDDPDYFSDVGRQGPRSGDHVDVMGNHAMIEVT
uniref:Phospholipid:diacylglycerol acyltransferase n=1 Tax=Phaeomonas parva TaxID=124430 RepID=A0A7S1U6V0_9STRA|mmetsp:Transcript_33490/g.105818  ORF Transcript_33490/g.105818 Transcript_33490/m.105818 type:complete len:638 (+) Transcript_33490:205-2118(+)